MKQYFTKCHSTMKNTTTKRMWKFRRLILYSLFFSMILLLFVGYINPNRINIPFSRTYLIDTKGCKMPFWDPFHDTVKSLFKQMKVPYSCDRQPSFLVTHPNSTISANFTVLISKNISESSSVKCMYQEILRAHGKNNRSTDDEIVFSKAKTLMFDKLLKEEFLYVQCFFRNTMFHDEFLALAPLKEHVENKLKNGDVGKDTSKKLNVIILGIDSISKLNFIRHFKKTNAFLTNELQALQMYGYSKVGDNTFPNLVPLLTGHFYTECWNESLTDMFFDDVDFIWKHFKKLGFRTLFAEDAPTIATFNYLIRNGFKNPPTDYYYRPFALALRKSSVSSRSKRFCFDSKMEMRHLFDYTRSFVDTMADRPLFSFTFTAGTTHDELNNAAYADDPTYDLLQHLHKTGVTNNSLVILMSDHGLRFGPIMETYIGKFEDRWPMLYMVFPSWFLKTHPELTANLQVNQQRLSTPFDVHATLLHLVEIISTNNSFKNSTSVSKGISLFHQIPETRTCEEAGIETHYCTCDVQQKISVDDPMAKVAVDVITSTLNDILKPHYNVCAKLLPKVVLEARHRRPTDDIIKYKATSGPRYVTVSISVIPSSAIFEATVYCETGSKGCVLRGDISRLNKYGTAGDCVANAELRKFCFCRENLH